MQTRRAIAVVNEKGGTGKTTTAVNLAAALGEQGQNVLLVDLDGQAASSRWVGVEDDNRLSDALCQGGGLEPIPDVMPNVSLAPASGKLDSVSHDLRPTQGGQLRKVLSGMTGFDYILIDCPPSLGNRLIGNALLAATHVIVPVETSILALDGLKILLTTLEDIRDGFGHNLILGGVLACRYDGRTRLSRLVLEELRRALPNKVFETIIRENVRMRECPASGQSILGFAPTSHAAEDYRALASEMLSAPHIWQSGGDQSGQMAKEQRLAVDGLRDQAAARVRESHKLAFANAKNNNAGPAKAQDEQAAIETDDDTQARPSLSIYSQDPPLSAPALDGPTDSTTGTVEDDSEITILNITPAGSPTKAANDEDAPTWEHLGKEPGLSEAIYSSPAEVAPPVAESAADTAEDGSEDNLEGFVDGLAKAERRLEDEDASALESDANCDEQAGGDTTAAPEPSHYQTIDANPKQAVSGTEQAGGDTAAAPEPSHGQTVDANPEQAASEAKQAETHGSIYATAAVPRLSQKEAAPEPEPAGQDEQNEQVEAATSDQESHESDANSNDLTTVDTAEGDAEQDDESASQRSEEFPALRALAQKLAEQNQSSEAKMQAEEQESHDKERSWKQLLSKP